MKCNLNSKYLPAGAYKFVPCKIAPLPTNFYSLEYVGQEIGEDKPRA